MEACSVAVVARGSPDWVIVYGNDGLSDSLSERPAAIPRQVLAREVDPVAPRGDRPPPAETRTLSFYRFDLVMAGRLTPRHAPSASASASARKGAGSPTS